MLMSSVIDPSILNNTKYEDVGYQQNVERYLHGILDNGLLMVDSGDKLKNDLLDSADKLGQTTRGVSSRILVEEIVKLGKRKLVKALPQHEPKVSISLTSYVCELSNHCETDALLTCRDQIPHIANDRANGIIAIEDYSSFLPFEVRRHDLSKDSHQINDIPESEFHNLIIKAIKYSKWLRFYDSQIGRGGNNLWSFHKGIEKVLTLFTQLGYFRQEPGGFVEIYTKQSVLDESAFKRVKSVLLDPLVASFPSLKIRLFIKADEKSIFHARFLESQHAIVNIDLGFDLFHTNGDLRTNFIRLDQKMVGHLESCRKLADLYKEM